MNLDSVKLIEPKQHYDKRGFFQEVYSRRTFIDAGISDEFVQDNHSLSYKKGTLRGLHFQVPPNSQAKLVRCVSGAIFDVVVDIRNGSPTYGKWEGFELTAKNSHQLYVPVGFAHGFITLEPDTEIIYKCSNYYAPKTEGAILWNDPDIGIDWPPFSNLILNLKDAAAPSLANLKNPFIYGENS